MGIWGNDKRVCSYKSRAAVPYCPGVRLTVLGVGPRRT